MTDKEIIRKMIKKQAEHYRCVCKHSEANALLDLLSIIDSMQEPVPEVVNEPIMVDAAESLGISQEEYEKIVDECIFGKKEHVSDDLEKASYCFACKCHPLKTEWSTSSPNPEVIEAFKAGSDWKKQQIMKDAVDAEVTYGKSLAVPSLDYALDKKGLDYGDKAKLIIIKED